MSENDARPSHDIERETHIDDELGLFIPKDLREFDSQIVFRTPRATIQHFGSQSLEGYYGMIHADQFGDPDEMRDPKNPELAPDRVKIKPQGEDPVTLTVETEPEIRTDGGQSVDGTEREWTLSFMASKSIDVQAETAEEARQIALEKLDSGGMDVHEATASDHDGTEVQWNALWEVEYERGRSVDSAIDRSESETEGQ